MSFKYSYLLPILCAVIFYTTFILTYLISVLRKDVSVIFPYISDTGTKPPESCIFSIMFNIGALVQALIMYTRYRQIKFVLEKDLQIEKNLERINLVSFWFGLSAAFGVCLVGNFQETNVLIVHLIGAFGAFGSGLVYQCTQTKIATSIYPAIGNKKLNTLRIVCCIISFITFIGTSAFGAYAYFHFKGHDITKWTPQDGGYKSHLVSAISEWILAIISIFFLLLFTDDFRKVEFSEPVLNENS